MRIAQYMSHKVQSARPGDGLRRTFFRMRELRIRHLPVVDGSGALVGIVSDRDLRRPDWVDEAPDVSHVYRLEDDLLVEDVMTTDVVVVHTYDSIGKAARLLRERRFGALPVLDKNEDLVGVLSPVDLLGLLEELIDVVKNG